MMAKQILVESGHVLLPEWKGTTAMPSPPTGTDVHGRIHTGRYVFRSGRVTQFLSAKPERTIGGIRPDVLAYDSQGPLLLEVYVTNRVDRLKRDAVRAKRYRMAEIDLSRVKFEEAVDADRFAALVLREASNRHWICLPEAEDDWLAAAEELNAGLLSANSVPTDNGDPVGPAAPEFVPSEPLRMPHSSGHTPPLSPA